MGFCPALVNKSFNHSGEEAFLTFLIWAKENCVHKSVANVTEGVVPFLEMLSVCIVFSIPKPAALKSRAIPYTAKQSPRFGVIETS